MDDYVMGDLRNYQNTHMMRFVMKVIFYAFCCVQKEDGLL